MENSKDGFKPFGYYVLVEMDKLEEVDEEFIDGSAILAPTQVKEKTLRERMWDQEGQDTGTLLAIGPTAYCGVSGILDQPNLADHDLTVADSIGRAAQWGVSIGDKVMFNKNNGKLINGDENDRRRLLTDTHIIGGLS